MVVSDHAGNVAKKKLISQYSLLTWFHTSIERKEIMNLDKIDIFSLSNFNELYKFEDIDKTKFADVWK